MCPAWFIQLVQDEYPKVEHQIKTKNGKFLTLHIQTQPLNEITEVWHVSVEFFSSVLLLTLLIFLAVNCVVCQTASTIVLHTICTPCCDDGL
jgi:two-component system sensor histidine kinase UhpB